MARRRRGQEEEFISCSVKTLPEDQQVAAAEVARKINPANAPAVEQLQMMMSIGLIGAEVLEPLHLAVMTQKYWGSGGVHLTVSFMDNPNAATRNRIMAHLNAWSEFCNAKFSWTQSGGQVRINRGQGGYWSYLGTDILSISQDQPTMNLQGFTERSTDAEYNRVVEHEAGHTLGFPHEHMRLQIVEMIDERAAIDYFRRTQGWSAQTVRQQVLTPLEERSIMGSTQADQDSIMCYQLPGSITKSGQPIRGGNDINQNDARFAATIYPKETSPPPPPDGEEQAQFSFVPDYKKKVLYILAPSGWRADSIKNMKGE